MKKGKIIIPVGGMLTKPIQKNPRSWTGIFRNTEARDLLKEVLRCECIKDDCGMGKKIEEYLGRTK